MVASKIIYQVKLFITQWTITNIWVQLVYIGGAEWLLVKLECQCITRHRKIGERNTYNIWNAHFNLNNGLKNECQLQFMFQCFVSFFSEFVFCVCFGQSRKKQQQHLTTKDLQMKHFPFGKGFNEIQKLK